jgi:hypothetical protein
VTTDDRCLAALAYEPSCCELACYEDPGCACEGCKPDLGARVEVASSDEGTQHYVPVTVRDALLALRAEVEGLFAGEMDLLDRPDVLAAIDRRLL